MRKGIFIGFIIVVLLVGGAIFAYLFGYTDVFIPKPSANELPSRGTQQPASGMTALTSRPVVSPTVSLNQRSVWYFDEAGKLFKNTLEGKSEQEFPLPDPRPIKAVLWQPNGSDFIERLVAPGESDRFRIYQAQSEKFVDYPANFQSVAWLPDGKRIVYVWKSGDGSLALKISNADGSNFTTVVPLTAVYEIEASPRANVVILYQPAATAVAKALRVDIDTKTITELLDRGRNIEVKFSPDGSKVLFNRVNEQTSQPELWVHDFAQKSYTNLKIATTISKTAWHGSSSKFYYALPESIALGDIQLQQKTKDTLYTYTFRAAAVSKLAGQEVSTPVDVRDMGVTDSETMLFFRNGSDNKLYAFKPAAVPISPTESAEPYD